MGHSSVARAGRFWSSDARLVEVVDVKAGDYLKVVDKHGNRLPDTNEKGEPIAHPCVDGDDPPPVPVKAPNPTTGKIEERLMPDPDRIGHLSLVELESDKRITIKQTDTVSQDAADAAVGAARAEVTRLSMENLELKARVAQLESGDAFKATLAELAEVKAKLPPPDTSEKAAPAKGSAKK